MVFFTDIYPNPFLFMPAFLSLCSFYKKLQESDHNGLNLLIKSHIFLFRPALFFLCLFLSKYLELDHNGLILLIMTRIFLFPFFFIYMHDETKRLHSLIRTPGLTLQPFFSFLLLIEIISAKKGSGTSVFHFLPVFRP